MNPLKELLELANQKESLEAKTLRAVAAARQDGHSWQAIANVIGGTKQAAQQRYGKAVLLPEVQAQAKDSIWTATPELDGQTSIEEVGQLGNETATQLDAVSRPTAQPDEFAGCHATASKILNTERAAKEGRELYEFEDPTPRRTDAPTVDVEDDLDRVETGELDTAGDTIDWTTKQKPMRCLYCQKTHHYEGKGRNRYFWIYPGCNPTHRDNQFRPAESTSPAQARVVDVLAELGASDKTRRFHEKAEKLGLNPKVNFDAEKNSLSIVVECSAPAGGWIQWHQWPGASDKGHRHYFDVAHTQAGKPKKSTAAAMMMTLDDYAAWS